MTSPANVLTETPTANDPWTEKLVEAAIETFTTMVGVELTDPGCEAPVASEVSAMIGLAGATCGVLTLRCKLTSAIRIASCMLGVQPESIGSQCCDAIGEICNIVAGSFKMKFPDLRDACLLAVPTVITGADYQLHPLEVKHRVDLSFHFEKEPLFLTLELRG